MSYWSNRLSETRAERDALQAKINATTAEHKAKSKAQPHKDKVIELDKLIDSLETEIHQLQVKISNLQSEKHEEQKKASSFPEEAKALNAEVSPMYDELRKLNEKANEYYDKAEEEKKEQEQKERVKALRLQPWPEVEKVFLKQLEDLRNLAYVCDMENYNDSMYELMTESGSIYGEIKASKWKNTAIILHERKFGDMSEKSLAMLEIIAEKSEWSYGRLSKYRLEEIEQILVKANNMAIQELKKFEKAGDDYRDSWRDLWESDSISPPYESPWDAGDFNKLFDAGGEFAVRCDFEMEYENEEGDFRSQASDEDDDDYYAERDEHEENADFVAKAQIEWNFEAFDLPAPAPKPEVKKEEPKKAPASASVSMPKKELVEEHKKLVQVLKKDEPKEVAKEAKKQEAELKTYKNTGYVEKPEHSEELKKSMAEHAARTAKKAEEDAKKPVEKLTNEEIKNLIHQHLKKHGKSTALSGKNKAQLIEIYKKVKEAYK